MALAAARSAAGEAETSTPSISVNGTPSAVSPWPPHRQAVRRHSVSEGAARWQQTPRRQHR